MYLFDTEVEILVNGRPVKKYSHDGRTYIEARKGSSYSVRIKNNSWRRQLYVVSVDGINVIDGKAAGSTKQGYVINGYSSYEVSGFRTSNEAVHPFKFNDKKKSYAAKSDETKGDVSNCGVIGVQVYTERIKPVIYLTNTFVPTPKPIMWGSPISTSAPEWIGPTYTCNSQNLQGSVRGSSTLSASNDAGDMGMLRCCNFVSQVEPEAEVVPDTFQAGTEFSKESVTDKVTDTEFEIDMLQHTQEIFYDYREGLVVMGVQVTKEVKVNVPSAFPSRFCKPPKD